jgi:hypothetical protein
MYCVFNFIEEEKRLGVHPIVARSAAASRA